MRSPLRPLLFAALAALAAPVIGQDTSLTGTIEIPAGPQLCGLFGSHGVADTNVRLFSNDVDLDDYLFENVRIVGNMVAGACPTIEVLSVEFADTRFSHCNEPAQGCPLALDFCPSPGTGSFLIFASPQPGYFPVSLEIGTFLLNPSQFVLLASGQHPEICHTVEVQVSLPPALVGARFFLQALNSAPLAGIQLTNVQSLTIGPPSVVCGSSICF